MTRPRKWSDEQLALAVKKSFSYRMVIQSLGLIPAGGNYLHVKRIVREKNLSITHFTGSRWNVGERRKRTNYGVPLEKILVRDSDFQSFKLKSKLFAANMKTPICEMCGWSEKAQDGRIPVELDHINGDHRDNRIKNLRILCPNCHSLQKTHRGKNKRKQ